MEKIVILNKYLRQIQSGLLIIVTGVIHYVKYWTQTCIHLNTNLGLKDARETI